MEKELINKAIEASKNMRLIDGQSKTTFGLSGTKVYVFEKLSRMARHSDEAPEEIREQLESALHAYEDAMYALETYLEENGYEVIFK